MADELPSSLSEREQVLRELLYGQRRSNRLEPQRRLGIRPREKAPAASRLFGPGPDYNEYTAATTRPSERQPALPACNYPSELVMFCDGATDQDAYWDLLDGYNVCGNTANTQMDYCADDFDATWRVLFATVNYYQWPAITKLLREYNAVQTT